MTADGGDGLLAIMDAPVDERRAGRRASGYASPSILARRGRILTETRRLIEAGGMAAASMAEVSRAAGVAKRTLYNAFGSRERMVAAAIRGLFADRIAAIAFAEPADTLDGMIERWILESRDTLEIRNYTAALMALYHAGEVDAAVRAATHDIAAGAHAAWLATAARSGVLQPWSDATGLDLMLVRYRYAVSQAWTRGLIADARLAAETARGMLTLIAGATRGATRDAAERALATLPHHPLLADGGRRAGRRSA